MTPLQHDPPRAPDEATARVEERRRARDQAAVGRERAAEQREAAAAERDQSQAEADQRTWGRRRAARERESAAAHRDEDAAERDQSQAEAERDDDASDGDINAAYRDHFQAEADQRTSIRGHAADDRRQAVSDRKVTATDRDQSRAAAEQRTSNRDQSARDRGYAAADRQATIADRIASDTDRDQATIELRRAQVDELTGAYARDLGMVILEREMNRARRGNGHLVLAYIDVDDLKQLNDDRGHLAGDELLRDVAHAIHEHLRSYDTLVRVGGDEFVCALVDCTPETARSRFQEIRATMVHAQAAASISVGFAELRPDDSLEKLTVRADNALYEQKRSL